MHVVDRERLGCDLAKLIWSPGLVDGGEELRDRVREMAESGSGDRMIMCRCDSRESVEFGRSVGITRFQGRFVESLIAEDGRRRDLMKLKHRIQRGAGPEEDEDEDDF